jgi:hypothetical protein
MLIQSGTGTKESDVSALGMCHFEGSTLMPHTDSPLGEDCAKFALPFFTQPVRNGAPAGTE